MTELVVVWRVTARCGLACPFCAYDRRLDRPRDEADPVAVRAFAEVLAASGRSVHVSWMGGEPLQWRPLFALDRALSGRLRLGVTTNGVPLARVPVRRHLVERYEQVTVSVDGVGAAHDRLRGASGLYDRLARDVSTLAGEAARAGRPLRLRANTVLMHGNVRDLERLCRALAGWGVRELTFNQLGGNDRPEFHPAHRLRPEDVAWLRAELPGLRTRLAPLGLVVHGGDAYLDRLASSAAGVARPVDDCGPGRSFLFVDERGRVAPCSFTVDACGVPIAAVRAVDELPALFAARRRVRPAPCLDCLSTQVFEKFRGDTSSAPVDGLL